MALLHNANWPSHLRVITRWIHTCTDHTRTHININQHWLVGTLNVLVAYLKGIQHYKKTHTHTHTLGIQQTWADWHFSKTSTLAVIYPISTHIYNTVLLLSGRMCCHVVWCHLTGISKSDTQCCNSRVVMEWIANLAGRQAGRQELFL